MESYQTWRDLLAALIEKPRERERLARAVGISTSMLQRWTTGEASPRPQQQQRLLKALPQHALLLRALLAEEFQDSATEPGDEMDTSLVEFSTRIFDIYASASDESRYWSICTAVLSEALKQLAPQHSGISLSVIECMAPSRNSNVRYLRECASLGTPPWPSQVEFRTSFLGAESLAGYAVITGLPQMVRDNKQEQYKAHMLPEYATSALALPILHSGHVAGCLLAVGSRPDSFSSPAHVELLQHCTALLKLAFSPEQFYPLEQVALQSMPPFQVQRPYLSHFQQRLLATLKTAFTGNRSLSYPEAQQYVWRQIAEELLQL